MAVKIDNYPAGRPQSGLDQADIVFEEPVEGGITRFAAVFQCQDVALIGPVRSARNIDIGILGQLGNPLLAHVGGINPVLANINASPLVNVDIGASNSLMIHPPNHVSPDADYTSTAIVYGTHPTMTTPPQPLFTYSADTPPGGTHLEREHRLLGHVQRDVEVEQGDQHLPALLQRDDPGHVGQQRAERSLHGRRAVRADQLRPLGRERPRG
jgi:hypothetical protein